MAPAPQHYFDNLIRACRSVFDQVLVLDYDQRPARARLEVTGRYGPYAVRLVEILRAGGERKYAYYVLRDDEVLVGFDNASDPRALRLKYGRSYAQHRLELIPHRHVENKTSLELTEEIDYTHFVAWVQQNVSI